MTQWYIVSWDCGGVEYLGNITEWSPDAQATWDKKNLFESLKQGKKVEFPERKMPVNPQHLVLRAQFNPQRHYEIYVFTTEDGVEEDELRAWTRADPQSFADWVRKYHTQCLYNDRARKGRPVVV